MLSLLVAAAALTILVFGARMIYSMTGYAAVSQELSLGTLSVEVRSVNHRYLDIQFRLPDELRSFEPGMREVVAARLSRGKVECRVGFAKNPSSQVALELNAGLLDQLQALEVRVRKQFPGAAGLNVSDVIRWPGLIEADAIPLERLREDTQGLLERALSEFTASRAREGEKLKNLLFERAKRMEDLVEQVKPRIPLLVTAYQERLAGRLRDAMAELDEDRIRQELAMFAAKVDVDEELSRLATHLSETRRILSSGGAVGKRLDFLMQELNREANTLGSKSVDIDVSQAAVELKVSIEQMREQVQNIE